MARHEDLLRLLGRAPCVFLDCDGVIFDSNEFKLRAMQRVLAGYPEAMRSRMTQYWRDNGGMARGVKFRHFFEVIAKAADPEAQTRRAVADFGPLSLEGYRSVDPLPGALAFARHVGRARCFVVSGAEQTELRQVFHDKQIANLFADVLGSPPKKLDLVRHVLERVGAKPSETLLIGDGFRDFEVCRTLTMRFVYLAAHSDWYSAERTLAEAPNVTWAPDWPTLLSWLGVA